jgi:hypothetical protein
MQDYVQVQWAGEPLSIEKLQSMIQNDQSVADELDIRPRGVIGYSELTMYASNVRSTGYKSFPNTSLWPDSYNNEVNVKEWRRVTDNWNMNPNGLSVSVNVEGNRIIHVELYIPLLVHTNPVPPPIDPNNPSTPTTSTSEWPIQGFKFVRDGLDISPESLVDTWTSRGEFSLSTSSFYYDCFDIGVSSGSHTYEVMWKSDQGLRLEIWDQTRNVYNAEPNSTNEPDQDAYLFHVNFGAANPISENADMTGRYNISDFVLPIAHTQQYTSTTSGASYSIADSKYAPNEMWEGYTQFNAPFAGSIPTAQLIITDCGSYGGMLLYKQDENVVQENINVDPTT